MLLLCRDLYGAIGVPVCLARTVIVGRKQELVSTILFILSYFIRCSEILENVESFPDFADTTNNHSGSCSETSSLGPDDDLTLKSPVPDCKEESGEETKSGFRTGDLDDYERCPSVSDCGICLETGPVTKGLALFVQPPELCPMNRIPLTDSKTSDSDNVDTPTSPSSLHNSDVERSAGTSPSKKKSVVTLNLKCRLKEDDVMENPKIEIERTLGRVADCTSPSKRTLHRVPLGDGDAVFTESIKDYLPAENDQSPRKEFKHSNQKATIQRGISMFDEYFESNIPVPYLNLPLGSSFQDSRLYDERICGEIYDVATLDDIVNEPIPDVSNFPIDRLPKRSGTFDTGIGFDFEDSTQLDKEHFGEMDIDSVVNLPDGPSKLYLQKAVSMLQDQFTTSGLSIDSDRMALSGDSLHERLDRSNSNHAKSKKNRNPSGQSVVLTNRCR